MTSDGKRIAESDGSTWASVVDGVVWLGIEADGKILVSLPKGQKRYIQGKTGSCGILGGKINIESRWIGFETPSGTTVKIRVMETDGRVEVEVL